MPFLFCSDCDRGGGGANAMPTPVPPLGSNRLIVGWSGLQPVGLVKYNFSRDAKKGVGPYWALSQRLVHIFFLFFREGSISPSSNPLSDHTGDHTALVSTSGTAAAAHQTVQRVPNPDRAVTFTQGRSQWGGRGGRLPPRTPKIGKENKNREGEKGGKERKKRERKRKGKEEERKRKGKGKGKGEEKGKERKREEKKGENGRKGGEEKGEEREEKRKKMLNGVYLNISNGMNFA